MGNSAFFGFAIILAWVIRATADGNLPNYIGLVTGGVQIPTAANPSGSVPTTSGSTTTPALGNTTTLIANAAGFGGAAMPGVGGWPGTQTITTSPSGFGGSAA